MFQNSLPFLAKNRHNCLKFMSHLYITNNNIVRKFQVTQIVFRGVILLN